MTPREDIRLTAGLLGAGVLYSSLGVVFAVALVLRLSWRGVAWCIDRAGAP